MAQALIDRFTHGTRSGATSSGMPDRQVMGQVAIAPGADAAAAIGCYVVRAPTCLHRPCKFFPVVQRKRNISRRVTLTTMSHGLSEICAAIPFSTAVDI